MSKRSIRKIRHLKPARTFKESVALGQGSVPVVMEEVPEFLEAVPEHVHGENCNH